MMKPTRLREMPSCSAIELTEIRRTSKIKSWIFSMISGVVTVFRRPGQGASQVEKSPRFKRTTVFLRWHTMVHVLLTFLSEWREFPSAPCLTRKTWWQLASPCRWNHARHLTWFFSASVTRKLLQSGTWADPLSNDTTDFVYDIGNRSG